MMANLVQPIVFLGTFHHSHWAGRSQKNRMHILTDSGFWRVFCNLVMHRSREGGGDKICKVEHQSILLFFHRCNERMGLSGSLARCLAVAAPATVCRPMGDVWGSRANKRGASKGHFINYVHHCEGEGSCSPKKGEWGLRNMVI